ncbi:MAG: signal recognition particle-docking protein FtsY [Deltaproteobacteria bacterium RIFOXYA12_FULL_61_11]|nr:MAG: signal recognition particle-docking protein FtsY [Deltaproteobacteria bacterium RIFOXYA12_FULL_61_11]
MQRLRQGLEATRRGFIKRIEALLKGKTTVDHQMIEELEETLITADLGVRTTHKLLEKINAHIDRHDRVETISELLVQQICEILSSKKSTYELIEKPQVILMVGVNGAGKTTTIAKLAKLHLNQGRKVLVAAADTYRAAAIEQLERWCEVVGVELVKQHEGADPSSVLFEAVNNAKNNAYDVLIIDTAGRLHTKKNLMEELSKMQRTSEKVLPGSPHEVLLVLDATTGQNAIVQAKEFRSATRVTDIVLTKLDGTAKGGIIIGIVDELGIPVKYIGIGERMDDLRPFNASEFTEALFQQ